MTLELSLRKPFSLPRVLRTQNNESQHDYHWVGQKREIEEGQAISGGKKQNPQDKKSKQTYRPLTELTIGEVDDVFKRFEHQLLFAQDNWIGKNYFCQIPLKRKRGYPSAVFGRVKTCYPSDGELNNIDELELYFPHKDGVPDILHIDKSDISQNSQRGVQSYFVRVRVLASVEEKTELAEAEPLLSVNGIYPEFESGYLELLDMNEQNHSTYPWMYVIGSRWFNSTPDSLREEIKGKLKEMIGWGKQIFNYHPEWLSNEISTLNRTLGYKYGLTSIVLTEPGNTQEAAFVVGKSFERLISLGEGSIDEL